MIGIRREIQALIDVTTDPRDNVLRTHRTPGGGSGPRLGASVLARAGRFPLPFVRANKFWPSVGRIDTVRRPEPHVLRPPVEEYESLSKCPLQLTVDSSQLKSVVPGRPSFAETVLARFGPSLSTVTVN